MIDDWYQANKRLDAKTFDHDQSTPNPFVNWLIKKAWQPRNVSDLLTEFVDVLKANSFPISRVQILIQTLHPPLFALVHTNDSVATRERFSPSMFPIILDSMLGTMNSTSGLARRPRRSINMSLLWRLGREQVDKRSNCRARLRCNAGAQDRSNTRETVKTRPRRHLSL